MDSDVSKAHIFYVIVSWSYFPFGSKVVARMEIDSVVSMRFDGKARWPGTDPKGLVHWKLSWCNICIDGYLDLFCLSFG